MLKISKDVFNSQSKTRIASHMANITAISSMQPFRTTIIIESSLLKNKLMFIVFLIYHIFISMLSYPQAYS